MGKIVKYCGIDISHHRLIDLTRLADQAKPFYDWVEQVFKEVLNNNNSISENLMTASKSELSNCIKKCFLYSDEKYPAPLLFDGVGRSYLHVKACYYFFAWIIRDAPQQRLAPLITRIKNENGNSQKLVEPEVLAELIVAYRANVGGFEWNSIREVIVDRLEGSRRSIKGHEKEVFVRESVAIALQDYYSKNRNYGKYYKVVLNPKQVSIDNETYDVSLELFEKGSEKGKKLLIPVKTRETEGGGHAHLFSRDIKQAITTAKKESSENFVCVFIIAQNWSDRETRDIDDLVDHLVALSISPNDFNGLDIEKQKKLNKFIEKMLNKSINPV